MSESKVDLSALWKKRADYQRGQAAEQAPREEPRTAEQPPEPSKIETAAEQPGQEELKPIEEGQAPRNLYTLSDTQQAYIEKAKAEILEQIYLVDDTASLFLKAIGVMAICLNDKEWYNVAYRLLANVWGQGLGKQWNEQQIPPEFTLGQLETYHKALKDRLKQLDGQARTDTETALTKIETRGKAIYNKLPEPSKLNFIEFWK